MPNALRTGRLIGRGEWTHVFEGLWGERRVAVVEIRPAHASEADAVRSLVAGWQSLSGLEHPNLLASHGVVEGPDGPRVVLDLADDGSMADRTSIGGLPAADVVAILGQVVSALEFLAGHGLVHGNLKPSNVLVLEAACKVSDPQACRPQRHPSTWPTESVRQAAPELLAERAGPSLVTDVHSLGVLGLRFLLGDDRFEQLAALSLFGAEAAGQEMDWTAWAHASAQFRPVRELQPGVPAGLSSALARLTDRDPGRRPQTWRETRELLSQWSTSESQLLAPGPSTSPTATSGPAEASGPSGPEREGPPAEGQETALEEPGQDGTAKGGQATVLGEPGQQGPPGAGQATVLGEPGQQGPPGAGQATVLGEPGQQGPPGAGQATVLGEPGQQGPPGAGQATVLGEPGRQAGAEGTLVGVPGEGPTPSPGAGDYFGPGFEPELPEEEFPEEDEAETEDAQRQKKILLLVAALVTFVVAATLLLMGGSGPKVQLVDSQPPGASLKYLGGEVLGPAPQPVAFGRVVVLSKEGYATASYRVDPGQGERYAFPLLPLPEEAEKPVDLGPCGVAWPASERFVPCVEPGFVLDTRLKLVWSLSSARQVDHADASEEAAAFLGLQNDGWRLPEAGELESLLAASDSGSFPTLSPAQPERGLIWSGETHGTGISKRVRALRIEEAALDDHSPRNVGHVLPVLPVRPPDG